MAYDPTTRTPAIGLAYTGDAAMNANLSRIDASFSELGGGGSTAVADLTAQVAALDARVAALEAAASPARSK